MPKLEDDPFFSERVALAVRACLNKNENLNIISPAEFSIMRRAPLVRKLDRELNGELLYKLSEWRRSISASNALEILFDAVQVGVVPMVTELLDTAISLELEIDLETAYSSLEKSQEEGIPPSWILQMLGDEIESKPVDDDPKPQFGIGSI